MKNICIFITENTNFTHIYAFRLSHFFQCCIKVCVENFGKIRFGNNLISPVGICEIHARKFIPHFPFFFFGTFSIPVQHLNFSGVKLRLEIQQSVASSRLESSLGSRHTTCQRSPYTSASPDAFSPSVLDPSRRLVIRFRSKIDRKN